MLASAGWLATAQETAPPATPGSADLAAEALTAQEPPASKPPPTIAEFAAEPVIGSVALSPGGNYFAFVQRRDKELYIVVRDARNPDAMPIARNLGEAHVYGLKWIGDDRLVYAAGGNFSVTYKRGKLRIEGIPRLFATGHDLVDTLIFFKGDRKIETANAIVASDIMLITGDDTHFLLPLRVGRNLDLVRVDVRDGTWTTAASGAERTVAWYTDLYGNPIMRFDTNRRETEVRILIAQRHDGRIDWKHTSTYRFDRDKGEAENFDPIAPGPQPDLYYVVGRPPGADRAGIHLYNIAEQRYATEVFSHPRFDVEGAIIDPLTGGYEGASYWDDTRELIFLEGKLQRHFDALKKFFQKERNISFLGRSIDKSMWMLVTNGPRDPGTYHLYDMANARNEVIGSVNPALTLDRLGKTQPIAYKARDGLEITGYLTLPPNLPEGAKPPLIVYPHGGPEVRTDFSFDTTVQFLATRGYAVFQPNFRGSAGYGKTFVDAGNRQFGDKMQTDIMDGVQQLIDQGKVDGFRMCIFGTSYGGYAALMGAILYPHLYSCVVSVSGVTDLYRQVVWEREEEGGEGETYKYWVAKIGDPARDKAAMNAASPTARAAELRVPLLLMHGKADDIVPFEQFTLMEQAIKKTGMTQEYVAYDDTAHNVMASNTEDYLARLEAFFAKYLKTP